MIKLLAHGADTWHDFVHSDDSDNSLLRKKASSLTDQFLSVRKPLSSILSFVILSACSHSHAKHQPHNRCRNRQVNIYYSLKCIA